MTSAMTSAASQRVLELLEDVAALSGTPCAACAHPICGHEAVISIALGFKNAPRCLPCLATALDDNAVALRDHVIQHIRRRDCYLRGWLSASEREGFGVTVHPHCLWRNAGGNGDRHQGKMMTTRTLSNALVADSQWDAGDMGCGELVLELRLRLQAMTPGSILKLTARDPGAPEDLPAWCGMTGHTLLAATHPTYWIKRKEN